MKFNLLLSAALLGGLCSTQATAPSAALPTNSSPEATMTALFGNPTIVKAKGFSITRSDLDQVLSPAKSNYTVANAQVPADLEVSILDQLINIQVLLQTATDADRASGQVEADKEYTNLLAQFRSPDDLPRLLQARGLTVEGLRAKALQEAIAKAALKHSLDVNPTEDDAMQFYKKNPADFEVPEMVHARHILLTTIDMSTRAPLSTNTVAEKRQKIEEIRKKILNGEDFAALAKQYSEDPGTKDNGGELPPFKHGDMVAEFEAAAFSLPTNQVSDIVTSPYGFHLIKVMEIIPAKKADFATVEPKILDYLSSVKIGKTAPAYLKKLRADQEVEILDKELKSQDEQLLTAQAARAAAAAAAADSASSTNR